MSQRAKKEPTDPSANADLMSAARHGDEQRARDALRRGADASHCDERGESALRVAALSDTEGSAEVIRVLALAGAKVNQKDAKGQTLLHEAVSGHCYKGVRGLLAAGADPNARDRRGETPLHGAALERSKRMMLELIEAGASPAIASEEGVTPLMEAIDGDCAREAISAMIEAAIHEGASIDEPSAEGRAPLMWAAERGNRHAARRLLEAGADVMRRDARGRSALDMAIEEGYEELALDLRKELARREAESLSQEARAGQEGRKEGPRL